jgi:hypothetical protein
MPRVAMDYSKTVIYHFVCEDTNIKCSYVGSTTNFIKRKSNHKVSCCNENHKDYNFRLYQAIRSNGGWNNWNMKPLEEYPCENQTQQLIREQYWIEQLKPELNCKKAFFNRIDHDYSKTYYNDNKESILEKRKLYLIANAESLKEKRKLNYQTKKNDKKT